MFKLEWLNKIIFWIAIIIIPMIGLTYLWNFVMPTLGIGQLNVFQFTALFIVVHSFKIELVKIKAPKKEDQTSGAVT